MYYQQHNTHGVLSAHLFALHNEQEALMENMALLRDEIAEKEEEMRVYESHMKYITISVTLAESTRDAASSILHAMGHEPTNS